MITEDKVQEFVQTIDVLEGLMEDLTKKRERFQEDNKILIEEIERLSKIQVYCKDEIKLEAIEEFHSTGNKKLFGGIGIREGITLIYEESAAFSWAKEHSLALNLDKRRFEQLAKTENMGFVTKEQKITVTFPKKIKLEGTVINQGHESKNKITKEELEKTKSFEGIPFQDKTGVREWNTK